MTIAEQIYRRKNTYMAELNYAKRRILDRDAETYLVADVRALRMRAG
jgi:hypothetical protein